MKYVNYYIFYELWSLLERVRLIDGVALEQYDPFNPLDVKELVNTHLAPVLSQLSRDKQELIRWTFEYYMTRKTAPFSKLRDRCQELFLADDDNPTVFMELVGRVLYGENYLDNIGLAQYQETPDETAARHTLLPSAS